MVSRQLIDEHGSWIQKSCASFFFNIDEWTQVLNAPNLYISRRFSGKYLSYAKPALLKDR